MGVFFITSLMTSPKLNASLIYADQSQIIGVGSIHMFNHHKVQL